MIKDVIITSLDIIKISNGDVLHAMKETSSGYLGFGEAYFSEIDKDSVKAWKRHKHMTLNLIVPVGKVKFVLFDDRDATDVQIQEITLSRSDYYRITIPPMIWVGFQGLSNGKSMLLNIANIGHDQNEVVRMVIEKIKYIWSS